MMKTSATRLVVKSAVKAGGHQHQHNTKRFTVTSAIRAGVAVLLITGCADRSVSEETIDVDSEDGKGDTSTKKVTREKVVGFLADAAPTGEWEGTLADGSPCVVETNVQVEKTVAHSGDTPQDTKVAFSATFKSPRNQPEFYLVLDGWDDFNDTRVVGRVTHSRTRVRATVNETPIDDDGERGPTEKHTIRINSVGFEQGSVEDITIGGVTCTMTEIGL